MSGVNPLENYREVEVGNNWDYAPKPKKEQVQLTDEQKVDIDLWVLSRRRNWPTKKRIKEKESE